MTTPTSAANPQLPPSDFMLDLETLGVTEDACVLSIGGLAFNPDWSEEEILNAPTFYRVIYKETQLGRKVDPETVAWWASPQRAKAKKQLDDAEKVHLINALTDLNAFVKEHKLTKGSVWACDPDFDVDIIKNCYKTTGLAGIGQEWPFNTFKAMPVRGIENFIFGGKHRHRKEESRHGTFHNALDDCISQALMVQKARAFVRKYAAGIDEFR